MVNFKENCVLVNFEQGKIVQYCTHRQLNKHAKQVNHENMTNSLKVSPVPPVAMAGVPVGCGTLSSWPEGSL